MQQPWLPGAPPPRPGVPDDFSGRTAVLPLSLVGVLLVMGRSEAILDAAYGLPMLPGTEGAIALAEAWNDAMAALGLPGAMRALREFLGGDR